MAKFNEILVGRYNRFLQRFLSMKGGPPSAQLSTEITSQIQLDDAANLENRYIMGWRSYASAPTVAAGGAGNQAAFRLRNPLGSGVIAVVEKISMISSAGLVDAPILTIAFGLADLTTPGSGTPRDGRIIITPASFGSSVLIISTSGNSGAIVGAIIGRFALPATNIIQDLIVEPNQEIVLSPNTAISIWSGVLNQGMNAGMIEWRERAIEEGELSA